MGCAGVGIVNESLEQNARPADRRLTLEITHNVPRVLEHTKKQKKTVKQQLSVVRVMVGALLPDAAKSPMRTQGKSQLMTVLPFSTYPGIRSFRILVLILILTPLNKMQLCLIQSTSSMKRFRPARRES